MCDVAIERLGPDDLEAMHALNAVFARCFEDRATYLENPPDAAYFARVLAMPHVIVLVARISGTIVGGLVAYELPKLERARSEVYIYDLAVDDAHRRQGIATALIAEQSKIAAEIGAWVSFVQADYDDPPAIALYEKLGTREDVLHFDIPPAKPSA